jgi:Tfp pilus assembly protein PilV
MTIAWCIPHLNEDGAMKGNRNTNMPCMRGISLTEGLVALVVLTVGLLALFNFQAGLLSSGAEAKARTEALQLADSKLGELRTQGGLAYGTQAAFVSDASNLFGNTSTPGSETVSGTNADFTVSWAATDETGPVRKNVVVTVAWTDKDGAKQVQLDGDIRWRDPALGVALVAKTLPGGGGIAEPIGTAEYSDESYVPGSIPSGTPNTNADGSSDGTQIYYNSTQSRYELIDSTGDILLVSSQPFSIIEGRIIVDAGMSVNLDWLRAGAPDVSWCTTTHNTPGDDEISYDGTTVFKYVSYRCYMGSGWSGQIGPQQPDQDSTQSPKPDAWNTNDRSCVGEPGVTDNGTDTSRHPQLSFLRTYRGYTPLVNNDGERQYDGDGNRLYYISGLSQGETFTDQDFYLNTITNPTDSDCGDDTDGMAQGDTLTGYTSEFLDNPGAFVCLTASCPDDALTRSTGNAVTSAQTLAITGNISGGTIASIITSDGDACTVNADDYSCDVYDLGAGWSGYIDATAASGSVITNGTRRTFSDITANDASSSNDFTLAASGTVSQLTVSGSITLGAGGAYDALATDNGGSCVFPTAHNKGAAGSYSCTYTNFTSGNSISLTFTTNKTVCSSTVGTVSSPNVTLSNVTGDVSTDINISNSCP